MLLCLSIYKNPQVFPLSSSGGKFGTLSELKEAYSRRLPLSVRKYCPTDAFTAFIIIIAFSLMSFVRLVKPSEQKFIYRPEIAVNLRSNQQNIHHHIKPEHQNNNRSQASICAKSVKTPYVYGKDKRSNTPDNRRKNRSRKLSSKS